MYFNLTIQAGHIPSGDLDGLLTALLVLAMRPQSSPEFGNRLKVQVPGVEVVGGSSPRLPKKEIEIIEID